MLHPLSPDLGVRLADCMGLDFNNVVAKPTDLPELPSYIPCVSPRDFVRGSLSLPAVAVPLSEVVSRKARSTERGLRLRHRLGISADTVLVVTGFCRDELLENAWPRRRTILRELAALAPGLATGFGFSVYPDDTRLEHMYNMKRSLVTYQLWQRHGVPAVPHISWFDTSDLDRWCQWLKSNGSVSMVALDLQSADGLRDWQSALRGAQYLHDNAPSNLSYLVCGVANPNRIIALTEVLPHLHVCNQDALMMAVQRLETELVGGVRVRVKSNRPREDIFRSEMAKTQDLMLQVRESATLGH